MFVYYEAITEMFRSPFCLKTQFKKKPMSSSIELCKPLILILTLVWNIRKSR